MLDYDAINDHLNKYARMHVWLSRATSLSSEQYDTAKRLRRSSRRRVQGMNAPTAFCASVGELYVRLRYRKDGK